MKSDKSKVALNNKFLEELHESVPCREDQIDFILRFFGWDVHCGLCGTNVPGCLYVCGHSGQGKTLTIKSTLVALKMKFAYVNCVHALTSKKLFQLILQQLCEMLPGGAQNQNCDSMPKFLITLSGLLDNLPNHETICIVLDKAEYLREVTPSVLPILTRIHEFLTSFNKNISIVLISHLTWDRFSSDHCSEPFTMYFPAYNREEIIEIMVADIDFDSLSYTETFYTEYLGMILSVFHNVTKNFIDLKRLCDIFFDLYCEPMNSGDLTQKDVAKLFRLIQPKLRYAMSQVHIRFDKCNDITSLALGLSLEIPLTSKYLLIAAYLASHNPPKTDKRFFVKNHGRLTKRIKHNEKKAKVVKMNKAIGPKQFPLDRLISIFYSITSENEDSKDDNVNEDQLRGHVSTLCEQGMLYRAQGKDVLAACKFKCMVGLPFIKFISGPIKFEVMKYLDDYL